MGALTHHPTHLLVDIFCVKGANYWEIFNEHAFLFENLKYIWKLPQDKCHSFTPSH